MVFPRVFLFLVLTCSIHSYFIYRQGFLFKCFFVLSLLLHYFTSASSILHIPCQLIGSTARAVVQSVKTRKCNKRNAESET